MKINTKFKQSKFLAGKGVSHRMFLAELSTGGEVLIKKKKQNKATGVPIKILLRYTPRLIFNIYDNGSSYKNPVKIYSPSNQRTGKGCSYKNRNWGLQVQVLPLLP